jgi:hypothetical protein
MQNNKGLNKGEWSELYTFLYLLKEPNLIIIDENLNIIDKKIFKVIDIILSDKKYHIDSFEITKKTSDNCLIKKYPVENISQNAEILLNKIVNHTKAKGSFKVDELTSLIDDLLDGKRPKGHSFIKGDLNANVLDSKINTIKNISYNIKSNLGSKATLLNASNNTNFIFRVYNIEDKIMKDNNSINTKTKLLDRCDFLYKSGAEIKFIKTESEAFGYNLSLIDSNLHKILADMLLLSYKENEKDIKRLLNIVSSNADENLFYRKKMSDFANAVTFGMRAGNKWNGVNEVNGGIILVTEKGEVCLLDLIYFKEIVDKYLINNIKFDSPSSSRYKMFEIYKEKDQYYFKLNLQVRFK